MTRRACRICGVVKALDDFTANKSCTEGREKRCKQCTAKATKDWVQANPNKATALRQRKKETPMSPREMETRAAWRRSNAEKVRAIKKRYRDKNKELLAERQRMRFLEQPEKRAATVQKWQEANKDMVRASVIRRRAIKANATMNWDAELDALALAEATQLALARESATGFQWDVDHIEPIRGKAVCGLHNAYNLAVVPKIYNQRKNNKQGFPSWRSMYA